MKEVDGEEGGDTLSVDKEHKKIADTVNSCLFVEIDYQAKLATQIDTFHDEDGNDFAYISKNNLAII